MQITLNVWGGGSNIGYTSPSKLYEYHIITSLSPRERNVDLTCGNETLTKLFMKIIYLYIK